MIAASAVSVSCAYPGCPYSSVVKTGAPGGIAADWYWRGMALPPA